MEPNFTSGPWSYDEDEHEVHSDVVQDNGGDPYHICEMLSTKRADAHLVAAAPCLYEALEKLIEVSMNFDESSQQSRMDLRRALSNGNLSIRKAKGEA